MFNSDGCVRVEHFFGVPAESIFGGVKFSGSPPKAFSVGLRSVPSVPEFPLVLSAPYKRGVQRPRKGYGAKPHCYSRTFGGVYGG